MEGAQFSSLPRVGGFEFPGFSEFSTIPPELQETAHRPWPLPRGPWIMRMVWEDLLFAHWSLPVETVRALVPRAFQLDTFDSKAWVAVTPLRMTGVRARGTPALPLVSEFPELNVR